MEFTYKQYMEWLDSLKKDKHVPEVSLFPIKDNVSPDVTSDPREVCYLDLLKKLGSDADIIKYCKENNLILYF